MNRFYYLGGFFFFLCAIGVVGYGLWDYTRLQAMVAEKNSEISILQEEIEEYEENLRKSQANLSVTATDVAELRRAIDGSDWYYGLLQPVLKAECDESGSPDCEYILALGNLLDLRSKSTIARIEFEGDDAKDALDKFDAFSAANQTMLDEFDGRWTQGAFDNFEVFAWEGKAYLRYKRADWIKPRS